MLVRDGVNLRAAQQNCKVESWNFGGVFSFFCLQALFCLLFARASFSLSYFGISLGTLSHNLSGACYRHDPLDFNIKTNRDRCL